jgi:hypothetical protein
MSSLSFPSYVDVDPRFSLAIIPAANKVYAGARKAQSSNGATRHGPVNWPGTAWQRPRAPRGRMPATRSCFEQACAKLGEASHLFIVLDKATLFVAAAQNARACDTELCDMGMGKIGWGVLCERYSV